MPDVLDRRALNRALLTRQLLVAPQRRPVVEVVEHLLGLQAQSPTAPYVGLWSRIEGFQPDELVELITSRDLVRILLMRGTLHLVSAADGLALRPAVQIVLDRGLASTYGTRLGGADLDDLARDARTLVEERPRTPNE
ncbi:MAG: winged helix DNA-binding domain-containing protein, partial [Propionibacteriales bacterium]|nr:winged helix DNA-binding domain-containing protein [Propionibacteriales bacterium]